MSTPRATSFPTETAGAIYTREGQEKAHPSIAHLLEVVHGLSLASQEPHFYEGFPFCPRPSRSLACRSAVAGSIVYPREDVLESRSILEGSYETLLKVCREVLAPLVNADGGVLYLVSAAPTAVHLHLAGTCAGCPGASITRESVLDPAVRTIFPKATLTVTTGFTIPPGAEKIDLEQSADSAPSR